MKPRSSWLKLLGIGLACWPCVACQQPSSAERFGKTIYLDGAGNWGFGTTEVRQGLKAAGYHGDVENFVWSSTFNPLLDQRDPIGPRLRAAILSSKIDEYAQRYPQHQINVIALSAGTGVATWAIENLNARTRVHNLVLLGSSLSADYDMTKALAKMTGEIVVYHSPHDWILNGPVKLVGTIDGKVGVESAGSVGLRGQGEDKNRIVNIGWSRKYLKFGWAGDHTDCTNAVFVREELARFIVQPQPSPIGPESEKVLATSLE